MLYYIHQTPLSSWSVEGGSGYQTSYQGDGYQMRIQIYRPSKMQVCELVSKCCPQILCMS